MTAIACQPLKSLHVIDRRDFAKDGNGSYILDKNGQRTLNWKCACGRTSAHSADYTGGSFMFVYDDTPAPPRPQPPVVQPLA